MLQAQIKQLQAQLSSSQQAEHALRQQCSKLQQDAQAALQERDAKHEAAMRSQFRTFKSCEAAKEQAVRAKEAAEKQTKWVMQQEALLKQQARMQIGARVILWGNCNAKLPENLSKCSCVRIAGLISCEHCLDCCPVITPTPTNYMRQMVHNHDSTCFGCTSSCDVHVSLSSIVYLARRQSEQQLAASQATVEQQRLHLTALEDSLSASARKLEQQAVAGVEAVKQLEDRYKKELAQLRQQLDNKAAKLKVLWG